MREHTNDDTVIRERGAEHGRVLRLTSGPRRSFVISLDCDVRRSLLDVFSHSQREIILIQLDFDVRCSLADVVAGVKELCSRICF